MLYELAPSVFFSRGPISLSLVFCAYAGGRTNLRKEGRGEERREEEAYIRVITVIKAISVITVIGAITVITVIRTMIVIIRLMIVNTDEIVTRIMNDDTSSDGNKKGYLHICTLDYMSRLY